MTGKKFLPVLFAFQIFELLACAYFLVNGSLLLAAGCILAILAYTIPIHRAYSHDPKLEVNGTIITKLQGFTNMQARILQDIREKKSTWEDYYKAVEKEAAFKKRIEIDPDDPRCIYRWKKFPPEHFAS